MSDRPAWNPSVFIRASGGLHAATLVTLALAPRLWPAAIAVLAADHLLLTLAGMWPRSRLLGPNLVRLPRSVGNRVALTFDDGPDPTATPLILDLLDRHRAQATFFPIGRYVTTHPELAVAARERGHSVENHTFEHSNGFAFHGPAGLEREIVRAQDQIERVVGRRPRFFRPPAGIRNPFLDPVLHRLDLTLTSWTRRGYDAVSRDPQRILGRLLRGLAAGDILLLHDRPAERTEGVRPVVLEVLPRLLDELSRRGLQSVSLEQALAPLPPSDQ